MEEYVVGFMAGSAATWLVVFILSMVYRWHVPSECDRVNPRMTNEERDAIFRAHIEEHRKLMGLDHEPL